MNDEQTVPLAPPNNGLNAAVDWVVKHWARVRLGHEAVMLDNVHRNQQRVEVIARNAMTGKIGDTTGWPGEEDGMGVDIGDHTHHHYAATPVPWWMKAVAAGLLLVSGGALASYFLTPSASVDTDTNTQYELRLGDVE